MTSLALIGKPFLTLDEAANLTRCSVCTVRRAISARRLAVIRPSGRCGRTLIRAEDLLAWLERSRVAAIGE